MTLERHGGPMTSHRRLTMSKTLSTTTDPFTELDDALAKVRELSHQITEATEHDPGALPARVDQRDTAGQDLRRLLSATSEQIAASLPPAPCPSWCDHHEVEESAHLQDFGTFHQSADVAAVEIEDATPIRISVSGFRHIVGEDYADSVRLGRDGHVVEAWTAAEARSIAQGLVAAADLIDGGVR